MSKQQHLTWNMRSILIDWLADVAEEYEMSDKTFHLSVKYIDNFLSYMSVTREKFQLVGTCAMFLAGKVEEIYPPKSKEWSFLTKHTFNIRQIVKMEQLMLKVLNFNMYPPTIWDFIMHLVYKLHLESDIKYLAMYLSELAILEGQEYLAYYPSELAASSLILACYTLDKENYFFKILENFVGYTINYLEPLIRKQQQTFKLSSFKKFQAIQNKYKTEKYYKVALIKPKILFSDDVN